MDSLIDETGKIWGWNALDNAWACVNASGWSRFKSIEDLDLTHGPLYKVARGKQVRTLPVINETVKVVLPDNVHEFYGDVVELHETEFTIHVVVDRNRVKLLESE